MTEPTRRYEVLYTAVANFSQLIRENARARQSNKELTEEHVKGAKSAEDASKAVTEAERKRAQSTTETVSASRTARSAIEAETKAKRDSAHANKQVSDSYDIARKSINDITADLGKVGQSTDKADSKLSIFARNLTSRFTRAKASVDDLASSVDKLPSISIRDSVNDPVGRRAKSLGGDGGRHRVLDDNGGGGISGGGGSGGGISGGGFSGDAGGSAANSASSSWKKLASTLFGMPALFIALASAIGPAIAALSSLAGPILATANTLASLGGVVAAAPGLFFALGTSIGAVLAAVQPMAGIFDAFKKQQVQAGQGAREMAQNEADAAEKVRDAARTYQLAERSVSDAQYDASKAQDNLNTVRRQALISLQDLRMESERGKLDQEGATLSLKRAEEEYAKVMNDPNASLLDRAEALHRVKEGQLAERDAKTKNHRTQIELNDAEKRGVDQNKNVIDATHQRDLANRAVSDSQYNLAKSVQALAKAQKEQAAGGPAALAANNALKDALDKASPSTRKVAEGVIAMNGAWKNIQKSVSEKLFAPFVDQLGNIKDFLPTVNKLLGDAAGALGDVGAKGVEMLTSGPWKADFATLSESNVKIIGKLGGAALEVAQAFMDIAVAAAPFTEWIAGAIERMATGFADWAKNARKSGAISDFLEDTEGRISQVWQVMKNIGSLFGSLYTATKPFTDWFLDAVERMTKRWADWGKGAAKEGSPFQKYLERIQPLLSTIAGLVGDFGRAWAEIGGKQSNIDGAIDILETLRTKVLPPLVRVIDGLGKSGVLDAVAKALGVLLTAIADFLDGGGSQSLSTFVDVISKFIDALAAFLKIPGVVPIIGGITAALGALAAIRFVNKLPGISHLIDGLGWLLKNKTGFAGILENLPGLVTKALAAAASMTGLSALLPGNRGNDTSSRTDRNNRNNRNNRNDNNDDGNGDDSPRPSNGHRNNNLPDSPSVGGWRRKGQSAADALYVIVVGGRGNQNTPDIDVDSDRDPAHRNTNTPDAGNESRRNKGKPGAHRGVVSAVEDVAEDVVKGGGKKGLLAKLAGGAASVAGIGLDMFGLPDISNLFGSKTPKPTTAAGDTAARGGAFRTGVNAAEDVVERGAVRTGARTAGRVALSGARLAGLLDPLTIAGTATGIASDYFFKDRKSTGAQATRAAGAVLTGAGIGSALFPGVGTAVGAAAGLGYSLYKDPGLRNKVGGAVSKAAGKVDDVWDGAYEGFMKNVGSPVAKWFRTELPKAFGGIGDFFTKTLPGWFDNVKKFFTTTIPGAVSGFFTETLPGWFDDLGHFFVTLPTRIATSIGVMAADIKDFITYQIPHFFTDTIPHWFDSIGDSISAAWDNVSDFFTHDVADFFTETIPNWFSSIGSAISGWWGESVVPFFTKTVPNFFTKTIPHWFSSIGKSISNAWKNVEHFFTRDVPKFFTQTIPSWFHNIVNGVRSGWNRVKTFFTKDVPDFFTNTIPQWFNSLVDGIKTGWNNAVTFFTKDVPDFFTNTIPNWFKGIGTAIAEYVVKPIADFFGGAWDYIKGLLGAAGKAYSDEDKKNKTEQHMNGGWIGRKSGGPIPGTYSGTEDQQRVLATPGEFMMRRRVSQKPGADMLFDALNNEQLEPAQVLKALSADSLTGGLSAMSSSFGTLATMVPSFATPQSVSSQTDNSSSKVMNFGDIHNHNPVPETSSRSIRSTVNSLAFRYADDSGGR